MRYLLDTGVWLWSVGEPHRINDQARKVLVNPAHEIYFSSVSVWEIAIKTANGKLQFPEPPQVVVPREVARLGLRPLQVTYTHALGVYDLPLIHRDPFDRLLVAQAMAEGLTLITADHEMRRYGARVLWAGR